MEKLKTIFSLKLFQQKRNLILSLLGTLVLVGGSLGYPLWLVYKDYNELIEAPGDYPSMMTKHSMARSSIFYLSRLLVEYTKRCDRYPENIEALFRIPKKNRCWKGMPKSKLDWNDPWDRMYQIRYLRSGTVQVRSQGLFEWTSLDDIVDETNFGWPKRLKELDDLCNRVSSDDSSCVYNRGWH